MRSIFETPGRLTLVLVLLSILVGCSSGGGNSQPILPAENVTAPELTGDSEVNRTSENNEHYLLLYNLIYVDPDNPDGPKVEVIPVRLGELHLNILKFLEVGPCTNCFKIAGFDFPEPGVLDVDIEITHPFEDLLFTVFDVKGIMMFQGSRLFPTADKTTSDTALGDGALLNADGYTALYNGNTIDAPVGDLLKYFPGNFSTPTIPDSDINGYIHYTSDEPGTNRNVFYHGTSVTNTFSIKLPTGPFVLGYAVDANWSMPSSMPPESIDDFGLDAQCPEPWKVVVTEEPIGDGLVKLMIDAYDWQGKDPDYFPVIECPELFDATLTAAWLEDGLDYTRYEVTITNAKHAPEGDYMCLIGLEAKENNPSGMPWLDLTAYQLHTLTVVDIPPVAVAVAEPNPQYAGQPVHFSGLDSYDPDGGDIQLYEWDWDNDGSYDTTGSEADNMWPSVGTYLVQLRVTDDESETDILDDPLEIIIDHQSPDACGEADPLSTVVCEPVHFTDCGSVAYDGAEIILNEWDWDNDGEYDEEGTDIHHTWDFPGIYFIQYRVTDSMNSVDELDEPLVINVSPADSGSLLWAKSAGGTGDWDRGRAITTLSDNSIVVTGSFGALQGGSFSATFGKSEPNETILTSAGYEDIFIALYNPDGALLWAKRAGGSDDESPRSITVLSDDSIVVTGRFGDYQIYATAIFGEGEANQTVLTSDGVTDIFIARYNPDGSLAWAKQAGGPFSCYGYEATSFSDNSIVVTGKFLGSATFGKGEPNQTVLTAIGFTGDIFIALYNSDGTLAWVKQAGGAEWNEPMGLTVLNDNTTVMSGYFGEVSGGSNSAIFGGGEPNETILTSVGKTDIFIARYTQDGTLLWAISAGGPGKETGWAITSLSDNSMVVTGRFSDSATFGEGEPSEVVLTSNGEYDIFVVDYTQDGTLLWAKSAGGIEKDAGWAITSLSDNSVVVTGRFFESATFGEGEPNQTILTSVGSSDIFIARYGPDGALAWAKRSGGTNWDQGYALTTLSGNSIVVSGYFCDSCTFGEGEPNQTVLTSAGSADIFIARYSQ